MSTKGPSIAPRNSTTQSSIAIASASASLSSGSTPRSVASSPQNINPASPPSIENNNQTLSRPANSNMTTSIVTSKEWVLPPRPKPGRKPSVDTPASKRKAQNRAAQRAFRERRATRVQELEQKLMEVEKEKDIKEMALLNTINKLKAENHFLSRNLDQLRQDMNMFRATQEQMKTQMQMQSQSQSQSQPPPPPPQQQQQQQKQKQYSQQDEPVSNMISPFQSSSMHPLISRQHSQQQQHQLKTTISSHSSPAKNSISPSGSSYSLQQISPAPSADSSPQNTSNQNSGVSNQTLTPLSSDTTPNKLDQTVGNGSTVALEFDCGICLKEECLCESIGLKESSSKNAIELEKELTEQLKSFQPEPAVSLPRKRKATNEEEPKEIDFTIQFVSKPRPMPDLKKLKKTTLSELAPTMTMKSPITQDTFNENSPVENCGFCSDDTPCVCKEAAKEAARLNASLNESENEMIMEEEESTHFESDKTLPPLQYNSNCNNINKSSLPVMHPGPSVEIREITNLTPGAVPAVIPRRKEENQGQTSSSQPEDNNSEDNVCTGNPGNCRQCQMDPMSTLFCTTVASKSNDSSIRPNLSRNSSKTMLSLSFATNKNENSNNAQSPIPPPLIATGSYKNTSTSNAASPGSSTSGSMFIPCADAYKTLSRHKKFNSVDFSTLVGKLTTRGMQVEVQSVANVLRELDRRLYN
ncbi:hypothetical protein KGF56_001786 [Candida oxycetoniae]|uniref:BZIP domain-containing protein n=1 Tax=Candida oxycetoniae TaxID=497107 RepID=A0AAI9SZ06_9ASCO|nr:uncharacterized protein KGF56_001786 [Candida oxycetoniae]KAI3405390.2 hypothetical protein KGF56_001786 [Candida oxycetoniae]